MAEDLMIIEGSKEQQYQQLLPQIEALVKGEANLTANTANICAALKQQFNWLWVGFYWVDNDTELVLGTFQGSIACTRIKKGKGVCGSVWQQLKTLIVPNVHQFAGHIACSSLSNSEIVIPIFKNETFIGLLDVDSEHFNCFDEIDAAYLQKIIHLINL